MRDSSVDNFLGKGGSDRAASIFLKDTKDIVGADDVVGEDSSSEESSDGSGSLLSEMAQDVKEALQYAGQAVTDWYNGKGQDYGDLSVPQKLVHGDFKGAINDVDNYYTNNARQRFEQLRDDDGNVTPESVSEAENGSSYGYDATGSAPIYDPDSNYDYSTTEFADNLPGHMGRDIRDWSNSVNQDFDTVWESGGSEGKWKLYEDAVAIPATMVAATKCLPTPARVVAGAVAAPYFISGVVNAASDGYNGEAGDGSGGVLGAADGVFDTVVRKPMEGLAYSVSHPGETLDAIYEHPAELWHRILEPGMIVEGGLRAGKKANDFAYDHSAKVRSVEDPVSETWNSGKDWVSDTASKAGETVFDGTATAADYATRPLSYVGERIPHNIIEDTTWQNRRSAEYRPEEVETEPERAMDINTGSEYDAAINEACAKYGLDPKLGHAVAQTESQHGKSTSNVFGVNGISDPYESIEVGVKSLKRCIDDNGGDVDAGLREYNGNANPDYTSTVHQIENEYGGDGGVRHWDIDMSEVGNTMNNHSVGCVEAVTKLGKNNDFLGRELNNGVVGVPKLIEDAKAEGRYMDYDPSKLERGDVIVFDGDEHVMMYAGDGRIVGNSSSLDRIVERGLNEQGQTPTGIIKAGGARGGASRVSNLDSLNDAESARQEALTADHNAHAFDEVNEAAEKGSEGLPSLEDEARAETNNLPDPEEIFGKETKESKEPAFNLERQDGEPLEDYANRLVSRAHETMEPEEIDRALKAVTDLSERQDALGLPDRLSILGLSDATVNAMKKLGDKEIPLKSFSETDRLVLKKAGYEGDTVNAAKVAADYDAKTLMDKMIRQRAEEIKIKQAQLGELELRKPELRKPELKEEPADEDLIDDPESWDIRVKDDFQNKAPKEPKEDEGLIDDPESWELEAPKDTDTQMKRNIEQMLKDPSLRGEWINPEKKSNSLAERTFPKDKKDSVQEEPAESVEPITNKELRNRIEAFGYRLDDSNFNEKKAGGRDSYMDGNTIVTKHQNDTDAQVHHLADELTDDFNITEQRYDQELNDGLKKMWERNKYGVDKEREYYHDDEGIHSPDNRRFAVMNAIKEHLHDPEQAKADFPQFDRVIEEKIKQSGLETQVKELQDGLYRMRNQSPEAAVEASLEAYDPYAGLGRIEAAKQKVSNGLTKFKMQFVDEDYGAKRFDEKKKAAGGSIEHSKDTLYDNLSYAKGIGKGTAETLVESNPVEDAGKIVNSINKVFGEGTVKEHKSLHNIIQDYHQAVEGKFGNRDMLQALNAYLAANTLHRNLKARENRLTSEINRYENFRKNKRIDTDPSMDDSVHIARAKGYLAAMDFGGKQKQEALEKELHQLRSGGYQMPWRNGAVDARKVVKNAPQEVKDAAKEIYDYTDNLLNIAEKSGLISNKVHKALKGNFLPISKAFKPQLESALKEAGVPEAEIKNAMRTFDSIKGSNHDIHNVLEDVENYTQTLTNEAARNKFVIEPMVKDLKAFKLGREVDPEKVTDESTVVFGWENGKRVAYDVQDPLIKQAMDVIESPEETNAIMRCWAGMMDFWRAGTVNTPAFTVTQLVRQFVDGLVLGEGKMYKPIKAEFDGLKSLKSKDQDYYDFKVAGISHSNMVALGRGNVTKSVKQAYDKPLVTWKGFKEKATAIPSAVESSSRLGKFKSDLKGGADFEDAVMNAKRVAVDFGRHGSFGKKVNRYVPFFNAAVQGPRAYWHALREGKNRKRAAIVVGTAVGMTYLNWLRIHNESWYQDMSDEEKSRSWFLSEHLTIPKSQELGALCGAFENLFNATQDGKYGKHLKETAKLLYELLPGKPTTGPLTIAELQANYDLFGNREIVPGKYKNENFDNSYDKDKTSTMAVEIARYLNTGLEHIDKIFDTNLANVNPAQVEFATKGFGGQMTKQIMDTADWARGNRNLTLGKALGFSAKFTPDKHSSNALNDFYELKEKTAKAFDGTKESPGRTNKYNTAAMKKNFRLKQMSASDRRDYMFVEKVEHDLKNIKDKDKRQEYIKKAMRGYKK